jgi:hypothetical protein
MFMKLTKREITGIFLVLVIGPVSFGAWRSFLLAMTNVGVSDAWWPVLWFSFVAVFFFLGAIVWTRELVRFFGVLFIFLPGLFFMHSWEYIVVGVISIACIYFSSTLISGEEDERTHFHFFKCVRAGSFVFVLGLSLLIASGYYVSLKNATWEEIVPRFRVGEQMTSIIFKIASMLNPSFATLSEGDTSVDEFLLSLEQNNKVGTTIAQTDIAEQNILSTYPEISQFLKGKGVTLSFETQSTKTAEEIFLESGRKQIASLVGREVSGDEKISGVLSVALQNKLITLLRGEKETAHIPSPAIPFFLSLLLFLTLLSFASLLAPLCILSAQLLFVFLLWVGWLTMNKTMVEQETLLA